MAFFDFITHWWSRPNRKACVKRFTREFGMSRTGCRHEPKVATMAFLGLTEEGWAYPMHYISEQLWSLRVCGECMEKFKTQEAVGGLGALDSLECRSLMQGDAPMEKYKVFRLSDKISPFEVYYRFIKDERKK